MSLMGSTRIGAFEPGPDLNSYLENLTPAVVQPFGSEGISGWVFDVDTNQQVESSADITEHYTEASTFINDHIVRRPETVTLSGYVGELVFVLDSLRGRDDRLPKRYFFRNRSLPEILSELNNKLEAAPGYLFGSDPQMFQRAQVWLGKAEESISTIKRGIGKVKNVVGAIRGRLGLQSLPPISGLDPVKMERQQRLYSEIRALWESSSVVSVATPWRFFPTMAIQSISISQAEHTRSWSEVQVTLKEIRITGVLGISSRDFATEIQLPRVEMQQAPEQDLGRSETTEENPLQSSLFRTGRFIGLIP